MPQVDEFVSVSEAKNKLLDLIRRMKHKQEVVAITRDGVPSAVLLSMDQFEGLMETIEILSDQKSMRAICRSLKQAEKGQWVSHEAVFGREGLCKGIGHVIPRRRPNESGSSIHRSSMRSSEALKNFSWLPLQGMRFSVS